MKTRCGTAENGEAEADPQHARCQCVLVAILGAGAIFFSAHSALASGVALPVLHSARQVQELSSRDAARGYPVQISRAQVLLVQPSTGVVFLKDSSGNRVARAALETGVSVQPGDIVSVAGVTGLSGASTLIQQAALGVLGHAALPSAPAANFHALFSGGYDSQWVSVEGIVKSARETPGSAAVSGTKTPQPAEMVILLAFGWDELEVSSVVSNPARGQALVDTRVKIRAIVNNEFNNRNLLVGVHLFMPDLSCLKELDHPPADPFALPVSGIGSITALGARGFEHRVHVQGVITSRWDGHNFSLMDSEHGIWIRTVDPVQAKLGDLVDVAGFPSMGDFTADLDQSLIRPLGSAPMPTAVHIHARQALSGTHDAEPIEIDGRLVTVPSQDDPSSSLVLAENLITFAAFLPADGRANLLKHLQPGSLLRVRGICVIDAGGDHVPKDFSVLLRSPADITILESPSSWTPERVLMLGGLLLAVILGVIVWNVVLRRQVQAQTSLIRSELETSSKLRQQAEAAHQEKSQALSSLQSAQQELLAVQEALRYQATHDPLTGIWNREAIMEALRNEIERALRSATPLGVLLLDIDHFKPVNDTYGHLAGDETLREIGRRLVAATRPYDLVGRYGGEEFLVLLPGCADDSTHGIAERIRSAISSAPFTAAGKNFFLTISIGATVCCGRPASESLLLSQADEALYLAKSSGRDRVIMHGQPVPLAEHTSRSLAGAK